MSSHGARSIEHTLRSRDLGGGGGGGGGVVVGAVWWEGGGGGGGHGQHPLGTSEAVPIRAHRDSGARSEAAPQTRPQTPVPLLPRAPAQRQSVPLASNCHNCEIVQPEWGSRSICRGLPWAAMAQTSSAQAAELHRTEHVANSSVPVLACSAGEGGGRGRARRRGTGEEGRYGEEGACGRGRRWEGRGRGREGREEGGGPTTPSGGRRARVSSAALRQCGRLLHSDMQYGTSQRAAASSSRARTGDALERDFPLGRDLQAATRASAASTARARQH
ncbi:hypothetical protein BDZ91DRAFT_841922 [Kalaharituber pfeilii]|nr:hypothetical protein BDZ91DRAFT_841922 [Kalaharituber pfeilii]